MTRSAGEPSAEWRFPNRATPTGSSTYYSIRFAPAELRDALATLFGWRHQVRTVLDEVSDPGVARLKLDWWRDELVRSAAGAPRHPLSLVLSPIIDEHGLPMEPFLAIADQTEQELRGRRGADDEAQRHAAEQDLGALFELAARCYGLRDDLDLTSARRLGGWVARVRRVRDAGLLLRRGREGIAEGRLAEAGLSHEGLISPAHRHRLPALLKPVAEALADEQPRRADTAGLPRVLRIHVRIHAELLRELARSDYAVTDQRIGLTPLRKLWLAWRTR
jgi:phytoene synthase